MPLLAARPTRFVVAGDINLDLIARIPKFAGLGGDNLAPGLEFHCGGVGMNTALALTEWQVPVRMLGAAGKDWFGDYMLSQARQRRVDISYVQRTAAALTGLMMVVVSGGEQRTFFGSRGANSRFTIQRGSKEWLGGAALLHMVGYCFLSAESTRAARTLIAVAQRRRLPVSIDVGIGPARLARQAILRAARHADILFASREEAMALTRKRTPRAALRYLERAGAGEVVMKLGRAGCLFRKGGRIRRAPAFRVRCVDPTGCGDAFTAAFLAGWMQGWPIEEAALAANAAGAAAAKVVGAGENLPGRRETLRILSDAHFTGVWEAVRHRLLQRMRSKRLQGRRALSERQA